MWMGLLGSALEGAGQGVADVAKEGMRADAEEQRSLREQRARREDVVYQLQLKAQQEGIESSKRAVEYEKASDSAKVAGDDRRFAKFNADLGQSDLTEAERRKVFDENFNQKVVTAEPGGDRYVEPQSAEKRDILTELRRSGASGENVRGAREDYNSALSAERTAKSEALKERDQSRKETDSERRERLTSAQIDALAKNTESSSRRADAALISANRPAGSGRGSSADKPATTADLNRKLINAKEQMAEAMGVKTADVLRKLAGLKQLAEAGDKAAQQKMADLEPYRKLYRLASDELQNFKRTDDPESSKAVATQPKSSATTRPPLSSFMKN